MLKKLLYNFLHYLARLILFLLRWEIKDQFLTSGNMVIIVAPHTSRLDGFLLFVVTLVTKIRCNFLIWHEYYRKIKWLCDLLGGLPVYAQNNGLVDTLQSEFAGSENYKLFLTPEGGLTPVKYWKLSFYRIALEQKVPIGLAYLDYGTKTIGCEVFIEPSGDVVADCAKIADFYENVQAKHPENFNNLKLSERQIASFQKSKEGLNCQ